MEKREEGRKGYPLKRTLKSKVSILLLTTYFLLFVMLAFILSLFLNWQGLKRGFYVLGGEERLVSHAMEGGLIGLTIVFIIYLIVIFLLIYTIARNFTGPIYRLEKTITELANTNKKSKLIFRKSDEKFFHNISKNFNYLMDRLEKDEDLLDKISGILEKENCCKELIEEINTRKGS